MGAIFAVALARVGDVGALPGERVALVVGAGEALPGLGEALAGARAVSLLVGSERDGLPESVLDACRRRARIAINGDSLNAAMAATVALYELTRRTSRVPPS